MLTRMAGWLGSWVQRGVAGRRLSVTPVWSAQLQKLLVGSWLVARAG